MKTKKPRNIALLFRHYIYRIHMGIVRYAKEAGWVLGSRMEGYREISQDEHVDGIISHHLGLESILNIIREREVPTVDVGHKFKQIDLPRVYMDNKAIAEMAGEHLLSRGFENIAYVKRAAGLSNSDKERYHALRNYIQSKGKNFFRLDFHSFPKQLKNIPKPIAIMGENDWLTSDYVRKCLALGYQIPYEVAFISVDNDPLFCDVAQVPLTSVDNNLEERGYQAAQLLDRLMDGELPPEKPILIPPKRVVERESTSILAIPHMPTYKALEYIHENYRNQNLSVDEAVRVSGMCRRRLEDNFIKHVGHSMPNEILRLRIDDVKRLLRESDLKVYEIADECGFSSSEHMTKSFKRKTGMTPKRYKQT